MAAAIAGFVPGTAWANLCSDATGQIQQMRESEENAIRAQELDVKKERNDRAIDCDTQLRNATAGSIDPAAAQQAQQQHEQCIVAADQAFNTAEGAISKERNDIGTEFSKAELQLTGTCAWTPERITALISAVGQSVSQIEQGTAQLITAIKSGNSNKSPAEQPKPPSVAPTGNGPAGGKDKQGGQ